MCDTNCSICLDSLSSEHFVNGVYTIKECKHQFHTDCFLGWCKQGIFNCPLCRTECSTLNFLDKKQKLSFLRKISLRKCSPIILTELANNYRTEEKKLNILRKDFKQTIKEYKGILDIIRLKRIKLHNQHDKVTKTKDILLGYPILELPSECRVIRI